MTLQCAAQQDAVCRPDKASLGCLLPSCGATEMTNFSNSNGNHVIDFPYRKVFSSEKQQAQLPQRNSASVPTWRGARPPAHFPSAPSGYTICIWSNPKPATNVYVKRAVRKAHFKLNRAFKVIQGYLDRRSDGRSDGQTESIMANTALCIASCADAL